MSTYCQLDAQEQILVKFYFLSCLNVLTEYFKHMGLYKWYMIKTHIGVNKRGVFDKFLFTYVYILYVCI